MTEVMQLVVVWIAVVFAATALWTVFTHPRRPDPQPVEERWTARDDAAVAALLRREMES